MSVSLAPWDRQLANFQTGKIVFILTGAARDGDVQRQGVGQL